MTKESLCIHGSLGPSAVLEELRREEMQPHTKGEGFYVIGEKETPRAPKILRERDQKFQEDVTVVFSLKACAKNKDLCKGSRIHGDIIKRGLHVKDVYVGTAVVDMYAKCGALLQAQEAFDELPVRNVVSWNALIAGYVQQGKAKEALHCFEQMQREGFSPDAVTLTCILKACGSVRAAVKGREIHAEVVRQGLLENDIVLGTALVDMYAKCGALAKAQEVFNHHPKRDVVSWNALIAGYAQHGQGDEALKCFEQMQHEVLSPNTVTFISILQACGSIRAAEKGEQIHAEVVRQRLLEKSMMLGNALVDMYAKCGALAKAEQVFSELPNRSVVSWSVLIAGYVQHGHFGEALNCFEQMQHDGLSPDTVTFICILKAYGSVGAAEKGEGVHAEVVRQGLLEKDVMLGTALVDMYAKCGALAKAQEMFDKLIVRDIISWNVLIAGYAKTGMLAKAQEVFDELPVRDNFSWCALIAGYVQHGQAHEALKCFEGMHAQRISPNDITLMCILKACSSIGAAEKGEQVHAEIARQGLLEKDTFLGIALVDMYAKCGALAKAARVFDELPVRTIVTWNSLIAGLVRHGYSHEALNCFEKLQGEGLSPNTATFTYILKACGFIGATDKGKEIHAEVVSLGLLNANSILGTALVDMYAKCGALGKSQEVFDELPVRDVVSWSALISGYVEYGHGYEALNCFEQMQNEGFSPNAVTFTCILKACSSVGAVEKGEQIHAEVARQGLLEKDIILGNALVDMYAKCGAMTKAHEVFDELRVQDVVSWSALMAGYAQLGMVGTVFNIFNCMTGEAIAPDLVTFIVLLNACSHSGLVEEGQMYFDIMSTRFGIVPTLEHHACMVDLFGRAGHFDKALELIERLLFSESSDYLPLWSGLLGACQRWGNVKVGRLAFEHVVQLDEKDAAAYIYMGNIYAAASMGEEVE